MINRDAPLNSLHEPFRYLTILTIDYFEHGFDHIRWFVGDGRKRYKSIRHDDVIWPARSLWCQLVSDIVVVVIIYVITDVIVVSTDAVSESRLRSAADLVCE